MLDVDQANGKFLLRYSKFRRAVALIEMYVQPVLKGIPGSR